MKLVKRFVKLLESYSVHLAAFFSILFAIAGSIVSVIRYWQYDVFYYDFGIFDSAIWQVSRFTTPIIHHMALDEKIIFADHFSPSIFLLTPFFWIFPKSEMLLIAQALAVAISGFVLFLIGKSILKNGLYALVILLCYFLFLGVQNAIITDFHEVTLAALFFMLTWYMFVKNKLKLFILFFILFLGCKETMFLPSIGIAIAVFIQRPEWRKTASLIALLSIIWGLVSTHLIIPHFSQQGYLYASALPDNPINMVTQMFNDPVKRHTLLFSFLSFGFLPLLNPAFWFLIAQDFFVRFYPEAYVTRWGLGFHYSVLTAAYMAVSSIYSLKFIQKKLKKKFVILLIILMVLNAVFLYRVVLRGPFALAYNPAFYQHTQDFAFLNNAIKIIPKDATVMTQNNIAPHFSHQKVWLLISDQKLYITEYYSPKKPEYIFIDTRQGQNPNNHYGIKDLKVLMKNLSDDKNYKKIYDKTEVKIYKRVN